jgi:hypothetical protein
MWQKVIAFYLIWLPLSLATEIQTNAVHIQDAPTWLKTPRVERVVDRIQNRLEWDIRKVQVLWFKDEQAFRAAHRMDSSVLAVSQKKENQILLGPRVTDAEFDSVFGHELVHIILHQKFHDSIPGWLEEGLANFLALRRAVDYSELAAQPQPDLRTLVHPFRNTPSGARYHYLASTAVAAMIASRCDLEDLLQLSVGRNFETYLTTTCGITDLNRDFKDWVRRHQPAPRPSPRV